MTQNSDFSDELLNAFVDGELANDDKQRVYEAMRIDPALRRRVEELRSVRDLVHTSYRSVTPTDQTTARSWRWQSWAVAATLLVGFTLGWLSYPAWHGQPTVTLTAHQVDKQQALKVVFHVTRDDANAFNAVLDEAERLLRGEDSAIGSVQEVRIIANGDGLALFRADTTPEIRQRVSHMAKQYANLSFVGCRRTQKRMKNVALLAPIKMVASGAIEALRLQQQGFAYITL